MTQIRGYEPPKFKEHKPLFSKKTLWVLNIILIPLIFVLSQLGVEEKQGGEDETVLENKVIEPTQAYTLAEVTFNQQNFANLNVHWADLPNSQVFYLGFILNRQPISSVPVPQLVNIQTQLENNQMWLYLEMPNSREIIHEALELVRLWVPILGSDTPVVMAGELDEKTVEVIVGNMMNNQGEFSEVFVGQDAFVGAINSAQIGSDQFENFYFIYQLLQYRNVNERINFTWSSKTDQRILGVNASWDLSWFEEVSAKEFDLIQDGILKKIENVSLDKTVIMRYLMHQAGYNLPTDYFHTRDARYQNLDIKSINQQLAKIRNEIQKQF